MNQFLVHYSEIGLKGKNRPLFEKKLTTNIKLIAQKEKVKLEPRRLWGRIVVNTHTSPSKVDTLLGRIFGIAWWSRAYSLPFDKSSIEKNLKEKLFPSIKNSPITTFAVRVKKAVPLPFKTSQLEAEIGELIRKETQLKVNLDHPELTVFLEIINPQKAFLFWEKKKGLGGLPVGVSGKTAVFLSGGIDSPVAAFKILSRGTENIYLHFHSYPKTSRQSIEKTKKIVQILASFQPQTKLYLLPFYPLQKEVLSKVDRRYLVILYRRFMLQIGEKIAKKEGCAALVTGDSLGQVASQTLANLALQDQVVSLPLLRPLIAFSKEEIISWAKKINTYSLSILPHQDCCQLFLPPHPVTQGREEAVKQQEKKLNKKKLIEDCLSQAKVVSF